jgi:preprotein translocase subunit YajC
LKKGDRVALLGVGIALVERVDNQDVHVVLRNRYALKMSRNDIAWDQQNMRWEASLGGFLQTKGEKFRRQPRRTADAQ